jgi:hypothetical protein
MLRLSHFDAPTGVAVYVILCQNQKSAHRIASVLRQPDLDHSKTSVFQSLGSIASKRTYASAINDFITWYYSEPRLAFGHTVVLRYRYELEARLLAPATINLRLAAVRRLTYEAADNRLLSADLAASIRHVKSAKKLGTRLGNRLTCAPRMEAQEGPDKQYRKGKTDHPSKWQDGASSSDECFQSHPWLPYLN